MENNLWHGVRPKIEGAPMHPDDMLWEHGEECEKCHARYLRQLAAYNEWEKEYYGSSK